MGDITRLPKWAQKHIRDLERNAETSKRALDQALDQDTPSDVYVDEILCDTHPPRSVRRYIQARTVTFEADGLVVAVSTPGGINGFHGVRVSFAGDRPLSGRAVIIPVASNVIEIRAVKEFALDSGQQ